MRRRVDETDSFCAKSFRIFIPVVCMCLLLIASIAVSRAAIPPDLKYFKLVQMPGIEDNQLLYINLDREVFKYSRDDLGDIRLFDADRSDIPIVLDKPAGNPVDYPVSEFSGQTGPDGKSVTIEIKMHREPVTEIILEAESDILAATASVLRGTGTGFAPLESTMGKVADADTSGGSRLVLSIPETRSDSFQVKITGADTVLPAVSGVMCRGPQYRVVFSAIRGASYQLYWGAATMQAATYAANDLTGRMNAGAELKRARVGRGFSNPEHADNKPESKPSASGNAGLLIGMGLVLIAMLVIVFRRVGRGDPDS